MLETRLSYANWGSGSEHHGLCVCFGMCWLCEMLQDRSRIYRARIRSVTDRYQALLSVTLWLGGYALSDHVTDRYQAVTVRYEALARDDLKEELACGTEKQLESKSDGLLYFMGYIWIPNSKDLHTLILDEAHKTRYSVHPGADKMYRDLR
ncbi:hypothetical protein L1987_14928 [Smallanthus sonchifolius]|uniref:Uncharacterized protein n=1 Tax=Smallanthus sonchifolius TaxID=185202 RepID=A0ACB9J6E8_9ASTR|nr:hypothetical protein L1987_14928 [Smallanthus sonchifolius]